MWFNSLGFFSETEGDKLIYAKGEVPERSNGRDWKSRVLLTGNRGFESHPLRRKTVEVKTSAVFSFNSTEELSPQF